MILEEIKIMLNQDIQKYYELKEQMENIKAQLDILKENILYEMNNKNITKTLTEDGITATLTSRVSFEYKDELGMMRWLENNGFSDYIIKTIDTKALNKQLKTSNTLNEGLDSLYLKKTSTILSVSKAE